MRSAVSLIVSVYLLIRKDERVGEENTEEMVCPGVAVVRRRFDEAERLPLHQI